MLLFGERKGCNPIRTPITVEEATMNFKTIPLTKGFVTIVDEADYGWLNQWKWHYSKLRNDGYAVRLIRDASGKQIVIRMHRLIMNPPKGMFVDHINGKSTDNRRCNLRICTNIQNSHNRKINNGRKYKGVCFERIKWRAYIDVNKVRIHLGMFVSETDAAIAYNNAAKKYFGEFAKCNLI